MRCSATLAASRKRRCIAGLRPTSGAQPCLDTRAPTRDNLPSMDSTVIITSPDGETEAEFVPEANMVCCSLRHRGAELLDPGQGVEAYARYGKTMGIPLLHPWANRLAGPSYRIDETTVHLPAPEGRYAIDPNGLPIHGALPGHLRWAVAAGSAPDRLSAVLSWRDRELLELFPFEHELVMQAEVDGGGLTLTTTLRATGSDRVPVSFGFHPYLRVAGSSRRDWRISLGATQRLVLDKHMIPTGAAEPLVDRAFRLLEQSWDDGLAGLDPNGARFEVSDGETTLTVTFEEGFGYAQVYAPPGHDYICFEPMTAPTNALDSGEGLIRVAPGEEYGTRWSVTVTP
jgi:aldose 1-epimerase